MATMTQLMPAIGALGSDQVERLVRYDGFPLSPAIRAQLREAKGQLDQLLFRHRVDVLGQMSPNASGHSCAAEGFLRSLAWLDQYTMRRTPRPGWTTYGMKSGAERHRFVLADGTPAPPERYVTQDELLMAGLPLPGRLRGLAWLLNIGKMKPEVKARLRAADRA
jgi:hypothetical protein